jgi:DNA-binding response OmpR family regulator
MAVAEPALKCLVADDEPQIGALVREVLSREGYAADVVTDGGEAARRLAEVDYTLVVFDVLMPHKTGVELVHELRAAGRKTPVILMSSFLSEETLAACAAVDHLAFLQKPFGLGDLRLAIGRAAAANHSQGDGSSL